MISIFPTLISQDFSESGDSASLNKKTISINSDPEKGDEYTAEAWVENGDLIVRGSIFFMGKNQAWPKATDADFPPGFKKPDLTKLAPKIPEVIN